MRMWRVKQCANATRFIDFSEPLQVDGGANEIIVFMGDYGDKVSTSSSVLSLMKELQETFPNKVITLLGNHDLLLLLDTTLEFSKKNQNKIHGL